MNQPTSVMKVSVKMKRFFNPYSEQVQYFHRYNWATSPPTETRQYPHLGKKEGQELYSGSNCWSYLHFSIYTLALGLNLELNWWKLIWGVVLLWGFIWEYPLTCPFQTRQTLGPYLILWFTILQHCNTVCRIHTKGPAFFRPVCDPPLLQMKPKNSATIQ